MAQPKIILNIKAAAKYNDPTASGAVAGGLAVRMPDDSTLTIGGAIDSTGAAHTLEVWQLITCEDDGTGGGGTTEYCRLFLCSDRFSKPPGW